MKSIIYQLLTILLVSTASGAEQTIFLGANAENIYLQWTIVESPTGSPMIHCTAETVELPLTSSSGVRAGTLIIGGGCEPNISLTISSQVVQDLESVPLPACNTVGFTLPPCIPTQLPACGGTKASTIGGLIGGFGRFGTLVLTVNGLKEPAKVYISIANRNINGVGFWLPFPHTAKNLHGTFTQNDFYSCLGSAPSSSYLIVGRTNNFLSELLDFTMIYKSSI